ncbi:hypothetical protein M9458_020550, partial [Cirrhinus mrigala]
LFFFTGTTPPPPPGEELLVSFLGLNVSVPDAESYHYCSSRCCPLGVWTCQGIQETQTS